MDETEVQCEIACWVEANPEASKVDCRSQSEPWVQFPGKRGTLELGLGGLKWSIRVPSGYQTIVDPRDGKRRRLWETVEDGDAVVVQTSSAPFVVSVDNPSILDLCSGLEQTFADKVSLADEGWGGRMLRIARGMRRTRSRATRDSCVAALRSAETLGDVLDAIHSLAALHEESNAPDNCTDADDDVVEEEDHLFDVELTMKWDDIRDQVAFARAACADAASSQVPHSAQMLGGESSSSLLGRELRGLRLSSPASVSSVLSAGSDAEVDSSTSKMRRLTVTSPPGVILEYDSEEDFTLVFPGSSAAARDVAAKNSSKHPVGALRGGARASGNISDSDGSDGSWEMDMFSDCDAKITAKNDRVRENSGLSRPKRKFQREPFGPLHSQRQPSAPDGTEPDEKRTMTENSTGIGASPRPWTGAQREESCGRHFKGLQWCEIAFNAENFSVECTIQLAQFMDKADVATALGLALEYPLRVEIVPKKRLVDSLLWRGTVDVNASQDCGWHDHEAEEICGLLCLVPAIAEAYVREHVPLLLREWGQRGGERPDMHLFVGLLQALVARLAALNAGGCCCVCGTAGERPNSVRGQTLWHCRDPYCLGKFDAWKRLSSADVASHQQRVPATALLGMTQNLQEQFPFCEKSTLKCLLNGVYGVDTEGMMYHQMIDALAQIELWNEDPTINALFV